MRKLLGLMTVLTAGAIISVGCGGGSGTTTTQAEENQTVTQPGENQTTTQPGENQTVTQPGENQTVVIKGDVTNIKDEIPVDADVRAGDDKKIRDVIAKVKTSDGKIEYKNGYFKKEGDKLYFVVKGVPADAEVSIIFVSEKFESDEEVRPEKVQESIVAVTPNFKIASSDEVIIEVNSINEKVINIKPKQGASLPKAFELLNTNLQKEINDNFKFVGLLDLTNEKIHLYWDNTNNKLLALDTTNANASVLVNSENLENLDKVKNITVKNNEKIYVMIRDAGKSGVGEITVSKGDKLSLVLKRASSEVSKTFNNYVFEDDGMYAFEVNPQAAEIKDTNDKAVDNKEKDSNDKTAEAVLSEVRIAKWNYEPLSLDGEKEAITKVKTNLRFYNANNQKPSGIATISLGDKSIFDTEVLGAAGNNPSKAIVKVETKYIKVSNYDSKTLYDENLEVYALLTVKVNLENSNTDYAVVALKYNPFKLDKLEPKKHVLTLANDSNGGAYNIQVIDTNADPKFVVFKYDSTGKDYIYKVDFTKEDVEISKFLENDQIDGVDVKGHILAFYNNNDDKLYICDLNRDSNSCTEVASDNNDFAWVKILKVNEDDIYLIYRNSAAQAKSYLIKYNLSSNEKDVELENDIDNKNIEIKTFNNLNIMILKVNKNPKEYYLVDFKRKSIEPINVDGRRPFDIKELNLNYNAIVNYDGKTCYVPNILLSTSSWNCTKDNFLSEKSYFDPKTGKAFMLFENKEGLYYKMCTPEDCEKVSSLKFAGAKTAKINENEYLSYTSSNDHTEIYYYKIIIDNTKATISIDSLKYQKVVGYELEDVINLNPDILVKDPNYYYLLKELNN